MNTKKYTLFFIVVALVLSACKAATQEETVVETVIVTQEVFVEGETVIREVPVAQAPMPTQIPVAPGSIPTPVDNYFQDYGEIGRAHV